MWAELQHDLRLFPFRKMLLCIDYSSHRLWDTDEDVLQFAFLSSEDFSSKDLLNFPNIFLYPARLPQKYSVVDNHTFVLD